MTEIIYNRFEYDLRMNSMISLLLITVTTNVVAVAIDPCLVHDTIDEWKRSLRYSKESSLCDTFLKEGWYRVKSQAGEEMPTECPTNGFRCGTVEPVWLNGSYPEAGLTKTITACSSHFDGDCCKKKYEIQVKNCTGFYVYKLVPTTVCPQAYCFGKELPCPEGQTSPNGFSPGCRYEPCLSVNYKPMDEWERSFGNNKTDKSICDSFLSDGWYRPTSKAGNLMPTTCPKDGFRCGTIEPIWLNGNLPTVNLTTVNATACVSSFRNGCCSPSYNIQVRNCGAFNIYNLVSTTACPQAYCFGSEVQCPVGETSDTGFTPNCEFDPCYVSNYNVLSGQVKRTSNYTLLKNEKPIDDSILLTAWYKIESDTGNDIVMTKQRMEQCGTKYPIWMKGSLPSVTERVVDRKVCMSGPHGFCQIETDIKVKNCGAFRVYFLQTYSYVDAGYCFGTKPYKKQDDSTNVIKPKDIPWIVIVSILGVVIVVLAVLFVYKHSKRNTKKSNRVNTPPPPYSPPQEGKWNMPSGGSPDHFAHATAPPFKG